MIPSTEYANRVMPVPWTLAQHPYDAYFRRPPAPKPQPASPPAQLPQERSARLAARRIERLLRAAGEAREDAERLLDAVRALSRPLRKDADAVAELLDDLMSRIERLAASYNELQTRLGISQHELQEQPLRALGHSLDMWALEGIGGLRHSEDGRLSFDRTAFLRALAANELPINGTFLALAAFASRIRNVCARWIEMPPIEWLNAQSPELHACAAYGRSAEVYANMPLRGLLLKQQG